MSKVYYIIMGIILLIIISMYNCTAVKQNIRGYYIQHPNEHNMVWWDYEKDIDHDTKWDDEIKYLPEE